VVILRNVPCIIDPAGNTAHMQDLPQENVLTARYTGAVIRTSLS